MDGGIATAYRSDVTLEVPDIHGVEADDRDKESDVGLSQLVANEIVLALKHLLETIERFEKRNHGFLVCALGGGEAAFVHAVCNICQARLASGGKYALFTVS